MKDFFWTPVPNKNVEGTLWTELNDDSVKLDLDELDALFALKKKEDLPMKTESMGKPKKVKKLVLVDNPTRQQNVGIAITRFRMSYNDLRLALMKVDETIIHLDLIGTLLKLVPTSEEIETVQQYEGDWTLVSDVDRFFNAMGSIPRLTVRLRCMKYKLTFEEIYREANDRIEVIAVKISVDFSISLFISLF